MIKISREVRRFIPGIISFIVIVGTTAILLFLSMDGNEPPDAVIIIENDTVNAGVPMFFDGRNSTDPDGDDLEFHWTVNGTVHVYRSSFEYSFPSPGTYTVLLEVVDGSGDSDTATVLIGVS